MTSRSSTTSSCWRSARNGRTKSAAWHAAADDHASRSIPMDPVTTTTTLAMGTTTTLAMMGDPTAAGGIDLNVWSLIQQGALSTYPLLFCSVLVVAIALERAWALRGVIAQAGRLVGMIAPALSRGDLAEALG